LNNDADDDGESLLMGDFLFFAEVVHDVADGFLDVVDSLACLS
jgi:hypothetical protein